MKFFLLLFSSLALAEEAKAPVPKSIPIPLENQYRYLLLQKEMQILNLETCSNANVKIADCNLDWKNGLITTRIEPPKAK